MLSAREPGPRAPGWLPHSVGTVVLGAQPEPWAQDVHSSPRGLLLPMGCFGFLLAWWLGSKRQEVEAPVFQGLGPDIGTAPHLLYSFVKQSQSSHRERGGRSHPSRGKGTKNLGATFQNCHRGAPTRSILEGSSRPSRLQPRATHEVGWDEKYVVSEQHRTPSTKQQPAPAWEKEGQFLSSAHLPAPMAWTIQPLSSHPPTLSLRTPNNLLSLIVLGACVNKWNVLRLLRASSKNEKMSGATQMSLAGESGCFFSMGMMKGQRNEEGEEGASCALFNQCSALWDCSVGT